MLALLHKTPLPAKLIVCFTAAITVFTLFTPKAHAGGWPVRKGKLLTSLSVSYFRANSAWDSTGKKRSYPGNGYFASQSIGLYAEYGITRRWTGVASLPYVLNQIKQNDLKISQYGFGDLEAGLRYYLTNIEFKYYIAVQGTAIVPLYPGQSLGLGAPGTDLSVMMSGAGTKYYFTVQAGGRAYFSDTGPKQFRYSGTIGYNIDEHNQVSAGLSGVISSSTNKAFNVNIVQNRDFAYHQASLSYGYLLNRDLSFFATVNQFLFGRNTGVGTNVALSVSKKF
ncbi:hypothetical protein [Mucilaginibacter terrae]|uniref:Transporter n=1 Tax=Mucilaginibacter terrae TaxID=1955052 RepID=A0ABU3GTR5_9SPHI|nr:hypothetical protein [Mucilaginibacter terrae]MDT3403173.1 hypothetical protein [Mucilaginibacter terrae]